MCVFFFRYPNVEGFAPVTPDTFENEDTPVEVNPRMVHESKVYVAIGYNGENVLFGKEVDLQIILI